jgi:hypothetical protein
MAHTLTYDTFPPHSNLRREVIGAVVKITAPAEEPSSHARRIEMQRAAFPGALLSGALLLAFVLAVGSMYLAHRPFMGRWLFMVLFIAFIIFCGALFLLVWRVQYTGRLDRLEQALRQTTILAASPGQLLIETVGPYGQASYHLRGHAEPLPQSIVRLRRGRCGEKPGVDCLDIVLADGRTVQVLPGRDEAELNWVARTLRGIVGI